MTAVTDFIAAVDSFMAAPKRLVGAVASPTWQPGREGGDKRVVLPLEVGGEQRGQALVVMAYPNHPTLMFRIGIKFLDHMVCRLDFEMEGTHANNFSSWDDGVPGLVKGPHWHSWEINRRLIKSIGSAFELHNATPFSISRQFDASLRWYCGERQIEIGRHEIELPPKEMLI